MIILKLSIGNTEEHPSVDDGWLTGDLSNNVGFGSLIVVSKFFGY